MIGFSYSFIKIEKIDYTGSHCDLAVSRYTCCGVLPFLILPDTLITVLPTLVRTTCSAAAASPQLCPTLCDPIDGSPPGSPIPGILQARTLEWVAISFSNAWKWKVKLKLLSRVRLLATPWTTAQQAPPSMGSSRQEYWSWGAIAFSTDSVQSLSNYQCHLS